MKKNKSVYIALSADILHHGHINLIKKAKKLGNLTVGLLTDKAVLEKKRLPLLPWENRKKMLLSINGVSKVIPQDEWDYSKNLIKIKPDIMVHGDDWKDRNSYDYNLRQKVIGTLKKINCKLVEIPHTKDISSSLLYNKMRHIGVDLVSRRNLLKRTLESKICKNYRNT